MKKMISLLLMITVILSLCACGNNNPGTGNASGNSNSSGNSISESDLADEWFEIKTAKRLILKNNGDIESYKSVLAQPGSWSLNGNTIELNSVDFLGEYEVVVDKGAVSLVNDSYTFMKWTDLPKIQMGIGEKGEAGGISITMNDLEYFDTLPSKIVNSGTYNAWGNANEHALGNGMIYAKISFDICNMSKSEIEIGSKRGFFTFLDYDNGFRFASYDDAACYYVSDDNIVISYSNQGVGSYIPVKPLETKSFDIYIECSEKVSTDTDASLFVGFISAFDGEPGFFEVNVRN